LELRGVWTNFNTTITALESAYEFLPQPTVPRDTNITTHNTKFQLADTYEREDLPIEILVGIDHYWKLVEDSPPLRISPSVVLLPSNLGWFLSGNRSGISANGAAVNFLHLKNPGPLPQTEKKQFWNLETIGITAHEDREWNYNVLRDIHDSFITEVGWRVVSLPKKENVTLPTNQQNAEKRFRSLATKLKGNSNLRHVYYTLMWDYVQRGQVEVVDTEERERVGLSTCLTMLYLKAV